MLAERAGEVWDRVVASDPGAVRLLLALDAGVAISAVIAVVYGFAQLAHPYWEAGPVSAAVDAQHHAVTVILMLLAGIFTMVTTIGSSDVTPRPQAATLLGAPLGMLASMAAAISLSSHHWIGIAGLTVVVGLGTWAGRFGPRATLWGTLGFMGFFFGQLAGPDLPLSQLYWLAAVLYLAALVGLALRVAVFNPLAGGAVGRGRSSFAAQARRTLGVAADLVAATDAAVRRRRRRALEKQLLRLNESALMFDGQLADPRTRVGAGEAQQLHEELFELELGLDNLSRVSAALADADLAPDLRAEVRGWLLGVPDASAHPPAPGQGGTLAAGLDGRAGDELYVVAALVPDVSDHYTQWSDPRPGTAGPSTGAGLLRDVYQSPVSLFGGFLAGSRVASRAVTSPTEADGGRGPGLAGRLGIDTATRTAIQVMVAVGGASALGSLADRQRFYWAAISGFIAFRGTTTAGEQVSRAGARVLGTFVGILIGSLLANLVGVTAWSLALILPAVAIGIYFQRVSYSLMSGGITIMIAILYVQLGEYSESLLALRLALTAIGAAVAMAAALLVLPVSTLRVTHVATATYLSRLHDLLAGLPAVAASPRPTPDLSRASRSMDDALMQALSSARPLAHEPFRHRALPHNLVLLTSVAHVARNLAATVPLLGDADDDYRCGVADALRAEADTVDDLAHAVRTESRMQLHDSPLQPLAEIGRRLSGSGVAWGDPRRRVLRQLLSLDGMLVRLERNLGRAR